MMTSGNGGDGDEKRSLSKRWNDGLMLTLAVVAALLAVYMFLYASPREVEQQRIERTSSLNQRFRELWDGEPITRFRDAQRRIDLRDLPSDPSAWASQELDHTIPVTSILREIAHCVRENECERTILASKFCEAVELYDEGFRALGLIAADYPDDTNHDIKWILAKCQ